MNSEKDIILYTLDEVRDILKLSKSATYDYIAKGKIKAIKFGRSYRVTRKELEMFIANREIETEQKRANKNKL